MMKHSLLKDENDLFQKEINRTLNFGQYIAKKKNPYNGENQRRDEAFRDIILKYKKKGLKIPNLSTDKNLFKPSALLIDNAELKQYFKIKKGAKDQKGFDEKETFYISKVNNLLYKRLQELDTRVDPSKFKNLDNFESNSHNTNLLGVINSPYDEFDDININQLKTNINKLKGQNDVLKETITRLQDNNDPLNESEITLKIRSINSPKKRQKPKIAYEEFLKRISKPKSKGLNLMPTINDTERKMSIAVNNLIGEKNPYKPVMKTNDGKIIKDGDVYSQYLSNLKKKMGKSGNFPNVFGLGNTTSTNFDSVHVKYFYIKIYLKFN